MKLTLKGTKPYPVWLTRRNRDYLYYRVFLPARMTGGQVIRQLQILNRARQVETFDIFDAGQRQRFAALPEATILGLGSSTVIPVDQIHVNDPNWLTILRGLRDCGHTVFLEADDDIFSFFSPDEIGEFTKVSLDKERASIIATLKASVPWMTDEATETWLNANLPRLVQEKAQRASSAVTEQYAALFAVTTPLCSTEQMRATIQRRFGSDLAVSVAPNCIDPADFQVTSREGDIIQIGYAGTRSHDKDMHLVMPGLMECAKVAGVELVFFGWHPLSHEDPVDKPREEPRACEWEGIRYQYGGQFGNFYEFCQRIGVLDVAVAPLSDSEFNRCKSPQKWFEHSMHGTAMVLSDSPVYDCVEHGVTGFKARTAEEFTHYLRLLVEDAELRRRMAGAARRAVLERHTVNQRADHWRKAIAAKAVAESTVLEPVGGAPNVCPWELKRFIP